MAAWPPRAVGDRSRARADGTEHVAKHLHVEAQLAAEVVVEHRLVDAGRRGDPVDPRGIVAAQRELVRGGAKDGGRRISAART